MLRLILVLIPYALAIAACDGEESASRSVLRDSAGVSIMESRRPMWSEGEGWVVDPSPIIDLVETGEGPNYEFFRVTDAARLPDGSFVVADDGDDEIRVYSPEGVYVRTVGRPGEGPGEFRRIDRVFVLPGDSILVYDYWQARITVFSPNGEVHRVLTLEGAYRPRPLLPLKSGGFIGKSTDFTGFGDEPGLHRMRSPVVHVSEEGLVTDTLTNIPGFETVVFSRGDVGALWGKNSHLAVYDDEVYLGSADSMEYRVRSSDGRLERVVRVPGFDLTLSPAEKEAEYRALMPNPSEAGPITREIMAQQPERSHRPAYSDLVVDVNANVWLKEFQGRHEQMDDTHWQVFDSMGEWLGPVTLPPRFDVFRIGHDWILGARRDELDEQHIQLLRLSRDPTSRQEPPVPSPNPTRRP